MANQVDLKKLRRQLVLHESYARVPYIDDVGKVTAGIGHNLNAHPIEDDIIERWYQQDLADAIEGLDKHLPWWRNLNEVRQRVLIDMAFNMGMGIKGKEGLLSFTNTLACIEAEDWEGAAYGMLVSKWYRQVKTRGERLRLMMLTGEDPPRG
jgi:lysozyme